MTTDNGRSSTELRIWIPYLLLLVLLVASGVTAFLSSHSPGSMTGPEGVAVFNVPDLAPASSTLAGQPIDGVSCPTGSQEVVKYHIHVHVAVYVNGRMVRLPAGIGITKPALKLTTPSGTFYDVGSHDCIYWLHTHVADGIIHVEAPAKAGFTLGQFFDVRVHRHVERCRLECE